MERDIGIIFGERQDEADLHEFRWLHLKGTQRNPALRALADKTDQGDRNQHDKTAQKNLVSVAVPKAEIDQRQHESAAQRDGEQNKMFERINFKIAIARGIQRNDANRADQRQ